MRAGELVVLPLCSESSTRLGRKAKKYPTVTGGILIRNLRLFHVNIHVYSKKFKDNFILSER